MCAVYIFDTETTDRKPPLEILEAAWIRLKAGGDLLGDEPDVIPEVLAGDAQVQRFKPTQPSTFGALAIHHILPHELENCPPSATFALPADCAYLIGHSIDFDWQAAGSPASVKRICTHAMAQHVYPDASGYSQTALLYMLLGPTEVTRRRLHGAHSAGVDVQLNAVLLEHLLKDAPTRITRWSELWQFSEECRIPRTCPMKRYQGVPLEDLDGGFIEWCLNQHWLDPYFRKGLNRVLADRGAHLDDLLDDDPMFREVDE